MTFSCIGKLIDGTEMAQKQKIQFKAVKKKKDYVTILTNISYV